MMDSTGRPCDDERPAFPGPTDCVGAFETDNGLVVIYEEGRQTEWIKSDSAVGLAALR